MNKEKLKIGFVVEQRSSYYNAMASTRLRAYDVIKGLKKQQVKAELYYPYLKYDIVIFQKVFSKKYIRLAEKLKSNGCKIIFDINVNYLDNDDTCVTETQQQDIKEFIKITDSVITASIYLKDIYSNIHHDVMCIEEIIEDRFTQKHKTLNNTTNLYLLYCGHATKAKELFLIKDILRHIYDSYKIQIIYICEKDPLIDIIPYKFHKYNHKKLPEQILKADIFINPRDISRQYNLGHSFTKIGYPMALGLPVIASPILSYEKSPAILCNTNEQWINNLTTLIHDPALRNQLALEGQEFVKKNFAENIIIPKYIKLFKSLI